MLLATGTANGGGGLILFMSHTQCPPEGLEPEDDERGAAPITDPDVVNDRFTASVVVQAISGSIQCAGQIALY